MKNNTKCKMIRTLIVFHFSLSLFSYMQKKEKVTQAQKIKISSQTSFNNIGLKKKRERGFCHLPTKGLASYKSGLRCHGGRLFHSVAFATGGKAQKFLLFSPFREEHSIPIKKKQYHWFYFIFIVLFPCPQISCISNKSLLMCLLIFMLITRCLWPLLACINL